MMTLFYLLLGLGSLGLMALLTLAAGNDSTGADYDV